MKRRSVNPSSDEQKRVKTGEGSSRRIETQGDDLPLVEFETTEDVEVVPTFDNMGLRDELLRGIYAYGMFLQGF